MQRIRTLRELQAAPDVLLCDDPEIAAKHQIKVPFWVTDIVWKGSGICSVEFVSQREGYRASPGHHWGVSEYTVLKHLFVPDPGQEPGWQELPEKPPAWESAVEVVDRLLEVAPAVPAPPPAIVQPAEQRLPASISPGYRQYIRNAENRGKAGFNAKTGRWYPIPDPAGGHTVGYGHQLTPAELAKYKRTGATDAEVDQLLTNDLLKARDNVYAFIRKKYGVQIALSPKQEQMLMDYAFNLGGVQSFPQMVDAVIRNDSKRMRGEYERSAVINGKRQKLTSRNAMFASTFLKEAYATAHAG